MTNEDVIAQLRQLFSAYPEDFRKLPGDSYILQRALIDKKAALDGPFPNCDPKIVASVRRSLEEGKQVAIIAAGAAHVCLLIANKRGKQLFAGP
ncbi:MAG: hypothetical protein MN733_07020, partial [Nitrososphaera sp.]|nr:hypothetical protein [Nitrososphaera sp.]